MKRYGLFTKQFYENSKVAFDAKECTVMVEEGEEETIKEQYTKEDVCRCCTGGCGHK